MDLTLVTKASAPLAGPTNYTGTVSKVDSTGTWVIIPALTLDYAHGPVKLAVAEPVIVGQEVLVIFDSDQRPWITASVLGGVAADRLVTGDLKMGAYTTPDAGFLLCDGASYLRADYSPLFTKLGGAISPWGLPDSTHFNVPDFRGRGAVGAGTGDASGATAHALGSKVGKQTHVLGTAEIPAHTHPQNANTLMGDSVAHWAYPTALPVADISRYGADTQANTGGGGAHENRGPSAVVNFFIHT